MAKKKFNREERNAIIAKLRKVATERENQSWDAQRAIYKPSKKYLEIKELLEKRNEVNSKLNELYPDKFSGWQYEPISEKHIQSMLNDVRDNEISHLVTKYHVNSTDLEVEIILMDQERPIDSLIEQLLNNCICK